MPMSAWLKLEGESKKHALPRLGNFCIGRNESCDLCLADPKASRNHAIVQNTGTGGYLLIDIASKNGCYVNNKRISSPSELKDGDQIQVGNTKIDFLKSDSEQPQDRMEQTLVMEKPLETLDIQEITILVADIRGFTALTESLPIEIIAEIMNKWFEYSTECVEKNHGTLDKFIGDCVYARWNSVDKSPESVVNALQTARGLNQISIDLNNQYDNLPFPIKIGIGVNTGRAVMDIGKDNTALGDAVNLAFRLEDHSKTIGKQIILSKNTCEQLPKNPWNDQSQIISVKGKKDKVEIVALEFDDLYKYLDSV